MSGAETSPRPHIPDAAHATAAAAPISLRWRLLAATLVALLVALALSGVALHELFREHVMQQFQADLRARLDQVTARLEVDAQGQPSVADAALADPRWQRPFSGWYWQIDRGGAAPAAALLRSRSLWDATLALPPDGVANGAVHAHEVAGPRGTPLLALERVLRPEAGGTAAAPLRVIVAADVAPLNDSVRHFGGVLAASLGVLALLLGAAAVAQVLVGLAPLRAMAQALQAVRSGRTQRLQGRFPVEVQPLIDDFNGVLDRHDALLQRARTQAGNLAHAVKTPLALLQQAADAAPPGDALAALVREQVRAATRHVDWHLKRARAAAAQGGAGPSQRTDIAPTVQGLVRVMRRVHAERGLVIDVAVMPAGAAFAGEEQDLQEMLGNLLDNACKWARGRVALGVELGVASGCALGGTSGGTSGVAPAGAAAAGEAAPRPLPPGATAGWQIVVDDDGPGIAAEQRERALRRGERLDESVNGTGLGLAIVDELAQLYGGALALEAAPLGGLRARLTLPAAA